MITIVLALLGSALLIGVDQAIKALVVATLQPGEIIPAIPGLLNWTYVQNQGAAFGILQQQRWLFVVLTVLMVLFCLLELLRSTVRASKWLTVSLVLIIAGGIGNLIDRIATGIVVDYISVSFFPPVFNFADCCIVVAAFMVVFYLLFLERRAARSPFEEKKGSFRQRLTQYKLDILGQLPDQADRKQ